MIFKNLFQASLMCAFLAGSSLAVAKAKTTPKATTPKADDDEEGAAPSKKESAQEVDEGIANLEKMKKLAPESDDAKLEKICAPNPGSKKCKEMTEYYKKKKAGESEAQMGQLNNLMGSAMDMKSKKEDAKLKRLSAAVKANCTKGADYDKDMCDISKTAYKEALSK